MTVLGIDLGTTNSACAIWTDDGIEIIPNRLGKLLTPSVVGYDDRGEICVGQTAKERLITHSDKTVAVFKRLMGTKHKIQIGRKKYTATELSALVLRSLKEDAEHYLQCPVERAVISVPAYFNDKQRHATKAAGEMAGLKVERLINEPTAAAMAYGLHEKLEGTFIILDMGGGTYDVSILEFFEGVMEVKASAGDNFLGGEDFVDAMVEKILAEKNLHRKDLSGIQLQKLYMQLETAKQQLSVQSEIPISLEFNKNIVEYTVTEEWFQRVSLPLLLRSKKPVERAMFDAQISVGGIDDVVLVGGSTRLNIFRETIQRLFGRPPACQLDPEKVVAMGTAIQAGLVDKHKGLEEVILTDVCPYTLGTEVSQDDDKRGGYFHPIIHRNSVVPTSVVTSLVTVADNQKVVAINVYQGEDERVENNVLLGEFDIKVPPAPAGHEEIDVRYSYDMNGLLEVDVTVLSTGKQYSKVIKETTESLSDRDIQQSLEKLQELKFHPRELEENRALMARAERVYMTQLGDNRGVINSAMAEFEEALNTQQPLEIKKVEKELTALLDKYDAQGWS